MLKEQEKTVQIFRKCLEGRKQEKLVIYGTGMNAEAVVRHCPDYRIEGLMDAAKTGGRRLRCGCGAARGAYDYI